MPRSVRVHQLEDLSNDECPSEIIIASNINTEMHIKREGTQTIIKILGGNKFDIVDGEIIIKESR